MRTTSPWFWAALAMLNAIAAVAAVGWGWRVSAVLSVAFCAMMFGAEAERRWGPS
jgi:hypothetical protein